jgi:hypothetical protein
LTKSLIFINILFKNFNFIYKLYEVLDAVLSLLTVVTVSLKHLFLYVIQNLFKTMKENNRRDRKIYSFKKTKTQENHLNLIKF